MIFGGKYFLDRDGVFLNPENISLTGRDVTERRKTKNHDGNPVPSNHHIKTLEKKTRKQK